MAAVAAEHAAWEASGREFMGSRHAPPLAVRVTEAAAMMHWSGAEWTDTQRSLVGGWPVSNDVAISDTQALAFLATHTQQEWDNLALRAADVLVHATGAANRAEEERRLRHLCDASRSGQPPLNRPLAPVRVAAEAADGSDAAVATPNLLVLRGFTHMVSPAQRASLNETFTAERRAMMHAQRQHLASHPAGKPVPLVPSSIAPQLAEDVTNLGAVMHGMLRWRSSAASVLQWLARAGEALLLADEEAGAEVLSDRHFHHTADDSGLPLVVLAPEDLVRRHILPAAARLAAWNLTSSSPLLQELMHGTDLGGLEDRPFRQRAVTERLSLVRQHRGVTLYGALHHVLSHGECPGGTRCVHSLAMGSGAQAEERDSTLARMARGEAPVPAAVASVEIDVDAARLHTQHALLHAVLDGPDPMVDAEAQGMWVRNAEWVFGRSAALQRAHKDDGIAWVPELWG